MTALSSVIKSAVKSNGMSANQVSFLLNSTSILNRELVVPKGDPKKLAPIVHNEMLQYLSGDDEYAIDFLFNPDPVLETPGMQRVNASSVPKQMVSDYHALTRMMGFKPLSLQMNSSAVAKIMKGAKINDQRIDGKSMIICDIGAASMNIYLFSDDRMLFSRCIRTSYEDFVRSLLALDEFNSPQDIYQKVDVAPASLAGNDRIAQAATLFLSTISEEIQRMIQFSISRKLSSPLSTVYLCGGVSALSGITENLCAALDLPVFTIDSVSRITAPSDIYVGEYLNTIAAIAE